MSAAAVLGIDLSTMDCHQKMAVEELVEEFADVFSVSKYDLGRTDLTLNQNRGSYSNQATTSLSPYTLPRGHM